jgi:hypothetical protein
VNEPFILVEVFGYLDGHRTHFRCASSLDGTKWAVICADNVQGPHDPARSQFQETNLAELLEEQHPFERMRPRPTLERALAEWWQEMEAAADDDAE